MLSRFEWKGSARLRIAWLSLLLLILVGGSTTARDRVLLDVSLNDSIRTISGRVEVTWYEVDSSYSDPHFRLWGNRVCDSTTSADPDSCGFLIYSIEVNGVQLSGEPTVNGTDLAIAYRVSSPAESLTVRILFRTRVPESKDRFGYSDGDYQLDGWFPMPAPHRDGHWLVVPYDDESELVGDFYDFEVAVDYPDTLQLIAPGRYLSDTTELGVRDQFRLTPAHDFVMLLGKEFKLKSFQSDHTTINLYYRSRNESAVDSIAASVEFTLDWMADHVGPYPFKELVVVEAPLGMNGGVEFPQMYWQSGLSTGEYARFSRGVAIHETLHQWFYGIIASNQAEEPWLDESITEYFTERINDAEMQGNRQHVNFFGITAPAQIESRMRGYSHLDRLPITRSALAYSREDYFPTVYGKGPMVIKTIVGLLGEREQAFWKEYYRRFIFAHPTERDFVALLNEYSPFRERQSASDLIRTAHAVDYQVTNITSEEIPDSSHYRSIVYLNAVHPLPYPVPLRLGFPSEPVFDTLLTLSPGEQTLTLERAEPVTSAHIYPDGLIAIDTDYLNNSYLRSGHGAAFRLFSGITFLVESMISLVWGI